MSKQKKQTSQSTNKQVANSNIGYQGIVTITTYKGKQRKNSFSQKNAGKQPLFNFLVSCLSGQLNENNRPNFIKLLGDASSNSTKQSYTELTFPIKATKTTTGIEANSASITYSFLIPYFMLSQDSPANKMYIYKAQLLNNADNVCAQADIKVQTDFDRPFLDKSKPDYSLVIDWKLSISNIPNNDTPTPVKEENQ